MHVLDLHLLQTFPFVNLNRGEDGSPKQMTFGGISRTRVSSQCWKRAIREEQKNRDADFGGVRTKGIIARISAALQDRKVKSDLAEQLAKAIGSQLSSKKGELDDDGVSTKGILFFSDGEVQAIADDISALVVGKKLSQYFEEKEGTYKAKTKLSSILKKHQVKDLKDIAMYGRMVASDPDMGYDGALASNHPFTIHESRPVIDFFSAVDEDGKSSGDKGSGHIDEALYSSGTFYRHIQINLDLLRTNLPDLSPEQIKTCIDQTIRSVLRAVPNGKMNSTNGKTFVGRALGIVRKNASSLSLADAFEKPVNNLPHIDNGWDRLEDHWKNLKDRLGSEIGTILSEVVFSIDPKVTGSVGVDDFCKELVSNV